MDVAFEPSVFIVSFLIGGAIGALIGSTKNRVLGGFLGCIGWIITAFLSKKSSY